jgi:hypothetical protein
MEKSSVPVLLVPDDDELTLFTFFVSDESLPFAFRFLELDEVDILNVTVIGGQTVQKKLDKGSVKKQD